MSPGHCGQGRQSNLTPAGNTRQRRMIGAREAVRCVFADIAPAWGRMMAAARERVLVFTPYLTSVEQLRRKDAEVPLRLYTEFSVELFASGASSFRAVKTVAGWGATEVFWLPELHAKVVVVDGGVLTIGSQNVTARGRKNREATVSIADGPLPAAAEALLAEWQARAIPITKEMLAEMEAALPPLAKKHRAYKKACAPKEDHFKALYEAEMLRRQEEEARRAEEERLRLLAAESRMREIEALYSRVAMGISQALEELREAQKYQVTMEEAQEYMQKCVYIPNHSSGKPAHVSETSKGVYRDAGLGFCWAYTRDSNKFMVEQAIQRCRKELESILEELDIYGRRLPKSVLMRRLQGQVFRCVAEWKDEEYRGQYGGTTKQYIKFGWYAVDTKVFVTFFLEQHWAVDSFLDNMWRLHELEPEGDWAGDWEEDGGEDEGQWEEEDWEEEEGEEEDGWE